MEPSRLPSINAGTCLSTNSRPRVTAEGLRVDPERRFTPRPKGWGLAPPDGSTRTLHSGRSLAFARMPRAEARGGMARGDRGAARRAKSVASAQFRLALPRMPRGEAQGASLSFSNPRVNKIFSFKFEEGGAPPAKLNGKSPWVAHRDQV
jgi:hypothetical protein